MTLTPAQQSVIDSTAPAILVSAGPGSGKSRVLVERIKRLVLDPYVAPSRIVVLTYTNAAAKVLTDRLAEFGATLQFVGTLHGWLLRLLTQHGSLIGLPASLSVVDADEEKSLLADALEEVAFRGSKLDVEAEVAKGPAPRLNPMTKAGLAAEAFFQRLKADGILTYDMILFYGERLLKAMQAKGRAFYVDHLLCDEVQDFTAQDWRIIEASGVLNVWCCGDFDQAIFAWRSGEKTNGFEERCSLSLSAPTGVLISEWLGVLL